ncbi:MAG: right-handed parallel beta-helix repeat-containing protein [Planctomycetota bacterium]|jgi:parallel beta-helix repeat protein
MKTAIVIVAVLSIPVLAFSATIYVPDDYPTIQGAIDASVNGDTIIVRAGTYVENIDFIGKAITLTSELGAEVTTIDGGDVGSVVTLQSGEGLDSVLDGFTLTNGNAGAGGGLYCTNNSSPTIMNCTISWNSATGDGGGVYCQDNSSPAITGNAIMDNSAVGFGGGICCWDSSSPTIMNNIIAGNSVNRGGGIYCYFSSPTIMDSSINGNTANFHGGGICCNGSTLSIANTIFWNNNASTGKEMYIGYSAPSTVTISHSDVEGGQASIFIWSGCTLNWGAGMIDADPLFADSANNDFHLTWNSPCRDAGDNSVVTEPYDFEGDPRICHGTVDMGADECYRHLYCMGDFTPGGSIEGKLVGLPGASPVGLFLGSGILEPPISTMWGNFHLQAPWFLIPLVPIPGNGILVLPATIPVTPPAPYDLPMQALIGLESDSLSNLYVLGVR